MNFLPIFLDEALEILGEWEQVCLSLEAGASESQIDALFRAAHNLKGSSKSVGLEEFGAFVHVIEDTITDAKKHPQLLTQPVIGIFLECQSALVQWINLIRDDAKSLIDTAELRQKLSAVRNTLSIDARPNDMNQPSNEKQDDEPTITKTKAPTLVLVRCSYSNSRVFLHNSSIHS